MENPVKTKNVSPTRQKVLIRIFNFVKSGQDEDHAKQDSRVRQTTQWKANDLCWNARYRIHRAIDQKEQPLTSRRRVSRVDREARWRIINRAFKSESIRRVTRPADKRFQASGWRDHHGRSRSATTERPGADSFRDCEKPSVQGSCVPVM